MNAAKGAREMFRGMTPEMTEIPAVRAVGNPSVSGSTTAVRASLVTLLVRQRHPPCYSHGRTAIIQYLVPLLLALALASASRAEPFNPPLPTFVAMASVGVRDDASNLSGDLGAQNIYNAFTQLEDGNTFRTKYDLSLTQLNTSNAGNINQIAIQQGINVVSGVVTTGTGSAPVQDRLFVFYINSHGIVQTFGNNSPKNVIIPGEPQPSRLTGDSAIDLSNSDFKYDLTSGQLAAMFSGPQWANVSKLFIMDTCYSGGFWTDVDGLQNLPHTAILAAADPLHVSYATGNSSTGNTGILGQAVTQVLQNDSSLQNPGAFAGYLDNPGGGAAEWADKLISDVKAEFPTKFFSMGMLESSPDPNAPFDSNWDTSFPVNEQLYSAESPDFLPAPEPSTLVLALFGFGTFLIWKRRRSPNLIETPQ